MTGTTAPPPDDLITLVMHPDDQNNVVTSGIATAPTKTSLKRKITTNSTIESLTIQLLRADIELKRQTIQLAKEEHEANLKLQHQFMLEKYNAEMKYCNKK